MVASDSFPLTMVGGPVLYPISYYLFETFEYDPLGCICANLLSFQQCSSWPYSVVGVIQQSIISDVVQTNLEKQEKRIFCEVEMTISDKFIMVTCSDNMHDIGGRTVTCQCQNTMLVII